ncbi:MAG TPA: hypothetical protein VKC15_16685 [Gemmatimonadales bacterium]|nr:hypothetical protein [Gemmatimonadales bacterium]
MRTPSLTTRLLIVVPLAVGCARAGAQTAHTAAAPPSTATGVAGNCPAAALVSRTSDFMVAKVGAD